jgi:hypothetical protein
MTVHDAGMGVHAGLEYAPNQKFKPINTRFRLSRNPLGREQKL